MVASTEDLQEQLDRWKQAVEKVAELDDWLRRAEKELLGAPHKDPRRVTYHEVGRAKEKLEKEIEEIERHQESCLTSYLEAAGPVTIELKDGTRRVLAARHRTAGGAADLLPADLLQCWRAAAVFGGSVATPIEFGDKERIDALKREPAQRKPGKRQSVTGEISLFEKGG